MKPRGGGSNGQEGVRGTLWALGSTGEKMRGGRGGTGHAKGGSLEDLVTAYHNGTQA